MVSIYSGANAGAVGLGSTSMVGAAQPGGSATSVSDSQLGGYGTLDEYEASIAAEQAQRVAKAQQDSAARIQAAQLAAQQRVQQATLQAQAQIAQETDQVTAEQQGLQEREQTAMATIAKFETDVATYIESVRGAAAGATGTINTYRTGVQRAAVRAENPYLWTGAKGGRVMVPPPPIDGTVVRVT